MPRLPSSAWAAGKQPAGGRWALGAGPFKFTGLEGHELKNFLKRLPFVFRRLCGTTEQVQGIHRKALFLCVCMYVCR